MNLVTGYSGKPHITTNQDSMWHRGIWKYDCIIEFGENVAPQIISNNEIQVRSGMVNMQGRFSEIPINSYDSLTINNGNIGENRIDLIVLHYEKNSDTQVESVTLKVIQGTPSDTPVTPEYIAGDIDLGDSPVELPIFQVNISGINITNVDTLLPIIAPYSKLTDSPKLIFSGAVRSGEINLTESIENFKGFYVGLGQTSSSSGTSIFYMPQVGIMPNYISRRFRLGAVMNVVNSSDDIISQRTLAGAIEFKSGESLDITTPFVYLSHTPSSNHATLSDNHYIREIWGVR